MGRERSVRSRANFELASREVSRPRIQVRRGVAFSVPLLAVALRTVLEVEGLSRFPLGLGADVLGGHAHRSRRRGPQRGDQESETRDRSEGPPPRLRRFGETAFAWLA